MGISQRLKDIEYQILKNLWFEPTDEQRVRMVKRIMYNALRVAQTRGEDLSAFAVDAGRPAEILGVALTFTTEGENVGRVFSLSRGAVTVNEDLETAPTDLGHIPIPDMPPAFAYQFDLSSGTLPAFLTDMLATTPIYTEAAFEVHEEHIIVTDGLLTVRQNPYMIPGEDVEQQINIERIRAVRNRINGRMYYYFDELVTQNSQKTYRQTVQLLSLAPGTESTYNSISGSMTGRNDTDWDPSAYPGTVSIPGAWTWYDPVLLTGDNFTFTCQGLEVASMYTTPQKPPGILLEKGMKVELSPIPNISGLRAVLQDFSLTPTDVPPFGEIGPSIFLKDGSQITYSSATWPEPPNPWTQTTLTLDTLDVFTLEDVDGDSFPVFAMGASLGSATGFYLYRNK